MEDNSDGCKTTVNTRQAISKFGHRSEPVNSPISDV